MEIIKNCDNNYFLNKTLDEYSSGETFKDRVSKNPKIADYFEYIYTYPPKIKIKWFALDELKEDLFVGSNYGVMEHSFPFIDFIEDWFFTEIKEEAISENYTFSQYSNAFLDKINTSNFFFKKTEKIQKALAEVPVYVIKNGQDEIILSKTSNTLRSKNIANYLTENLYDVCGAFDPSVEKKSELGLFFMDSSDAEKYLTEVANSDFEGTQTVGLSLHCISLDSAYKITREHHPGVDFRFVPNFKEVKDLLRTNIGKSDMIIEDEQQQLRFRPRNMNLFPFLKRLGVFLSPSSSFLQRNEYFKGVPIYIVQIMNSPRNFWMEQYFNIIGILDTVYGRCINSLDYTIGFGHNWIIQGSLQDAGNSDKFENYIFFEKEEAIKFSKKNRRNVARYSGSRTSNLESLIRKPKIFVYNLEDFLEDWEDNIVDEINSKESSTGKMLKCKSNHFIRPNINKNEKFGYIKPVQNSYLKDIGQALNVKLKIFKKNIGLFFSINY